jgi:hypothetical protein
VKDVRINEFFQGAVRKAGQFYPRFAGSRHFHGLF